MWTTNLKRRLAVTVVLLVAAGTAGGQIITVDDDGPADFNNIQAAINDSNDGDVIKVQLGIYTGPGNRDIDFLGKAITVRSLDPNDPNTVPATVIDCNGTETEPHRGFDFHTSENENSVLTGFTITNGYSYQGGAIRNYKSSPMIVYCRFVKNSAGSSGGGIVCLGGAKPKLIDCTFTNNSAVWGGGMSNWENTSPILISCAFADNSARYHGGGIWNYRSHPIVMGCGFTRDYAGHDGGGMSSHSGLSDSRHPVLINCTFTGNRASYGGGMKSSAGDLILKNSTLSGNSACVEGGGMYNPYGGEPILTNCIVWSNRDAGGVDESAQIHNYAGAAAVNHSCIQGWTGGLGGPGNMGDDPCFVGPGYWTDPCNTPADTNDDVWLYGDYHLLPNSPCVDAGDNNSIPPDVADLDGNGNTTEPIPWDLDGNARIVDGNNDGNSVVDMGACEFFVPPIEVAMRFTPQALNPGSQGNWGKAHFVLPEGFAVEDVDTGTPAEIEQLGIQSEYMNVFVSEEGLVEIEAAFGRADFCDSGPFDGTITVSGLLTSGQRFVGTDTIKIVTNNLKYVAGLASRWLEADCGKPDWCGGLDLDQDSAVNFVDFALFDGCCIEVITE